MTSTETPTPAPAVAKLEKHHPELLEPGESIVAAVRCGALDRNEPGAVFGKLGPIGRLMQRSLSEDRIEERTRRVRLYLHRRGLEPVEFPPSKIGYQLALTESRVLLFDASAKNFMSDSRIHNMFLDHIDVDDRTVLLFIEGKEAAAVTAWADAEDVSRFVEHYRSAQRSNAPRRVG